MIDVQPIPVTRRGLKPSPFLKVYDFEVHKFIWINLDMICSVEVLTATSVNICLANGDTLCVGMTEDEAKLNLMGILPAGYEWRDADESHAYEKDIS